MRFWKMFALLIITGNFLSFVNSSFTKSRSWHEEFVRYRKGQHSKILYPRYKVCRAPREKPEKIKQRSIHAAVKTVEISWADLLSRYSADSGAEIYNWDYWKLKTDPNKSTRLHQFIGLLQFLGLFIIIFTLFVFLVPIVGGTGFKFYSLIWHVIFHPEIRRMGRRMFILKEQSRHRMYQFFPKTADKSQQKRKQFRLPFWLREFNEEEIPEELIVSNEEDSDGEISSDGFENLLIRTKTKGGAHGKTPVKNLVHLMASTEAELANLETESVFIEGSTSNTNRADFMRQMRSRSVVSKR